MTQVIEHKAFSSHLKRTETKQFPQVCLIYGEEFLYKGILDEILEMLLPGTAKNHNFEPLDGSQNESVMLALEHVSTYSMLSETKVVALLDSRIFYSKQDDGKLIEKINTEYANDDLKKAASHLLSFMSFHELDLNDLSQENIATLFSEEPSLAPDQEAIGQIIDYCRENNLSPNPKQDMAKALSEAVLKGFPKGNYLVITTDLVDKRRVLFKTILEKGVIVDCSVPLGERSADKKTQRLILAEKMNQMLKKHQKRIAPEAVNLLFEVTGFDLRTFCNNIAKLIDYVGHRDIITADDIGNVLKRTKKDPIFELTAAISDRSTERALFFIKSLLDNDIHPLAVLTAMVNQVRKLLVAKAFLENTTGTNWQRGMPFEHFKNSTLFKAVEHDKKLLEQLQNWSEDGLMDAKDRKKKQKPSTDIFLAKNPKNPYPIYQTFLKTDNYNQQELIKAYRLLSETDFRLKRTGLNHRLILENAVIQICSASS